MDRTVHRGAVAQVRNGPYGPYMICIPENMDHAFHIGAVFKSLTEKMKVHVFVENNNQIAISTISVCPNLNY